METVRDNLEWICGGAAALFYYLLIGWDTASRYNNKNTRKTDVIKVFLLWPLYC